jgi:hypothetical protein
VFGITAVVAWFIQKVPAEIVWTLRIGAGLATVALVWLLWRFGRRRPEVLPDLLARVVPNYFERDGFCFAFVPAVTQDGQCWMQVFFQNRFEHPCRGRAVLKPPSRNFSLGRWPLQTVDVTVECEGAAFGVARVPWPIPAKLQGKLAKCEVAGAAKFPNGRGKLMRYHDGLRAGAVGGDIGRALLTVGALAGGAIVVSRPARMQFKLPHGVREDVVPGAGPATQILWRPDLPTGGFPVLPVVSPSPTGAATDASSI